MQMHEPETKWCDLFAGNMVKVEQLAGHTETSAVLRPMMDGMGK